MVKPGLSPLFARLFKDYGALTLSGSVLSHLADYNEIFPQTWAGYIINQLIRN